MSTDDAERAALAVQATRRLGAGRSTLPEAFATLAWVHTTAPLSVYRTPIPRVPTSADDLPAARAQLLTTILDSGHLARPAAAARRLLVVDGREPSYPDPDATSLADYAHHAWLAAHAEMASPRRRVRLAVNRWVRTHGRLGTPPGAQADLAAARDEVRPLLGSWARDLADVTVPSGLCELELSSAHARGLGGIYYDSAARQVLLHAVLRGTFARVRPSAVASRYGKVIGSRDGGAFRLVLPAVWAYWLTGPVLGFSARPGDPVAEADVATHEVALRVWSDGKMTYADAYRAAEGVVAPASVGPPAAGAGCLGRTVRDGSV